jgi:hypothetical protein
VGKNNAL